MKQTVSQFYVQCSWKRTTPTCELNSIHLPHSCGARNEDAGVCFRMCGSHGRIVGHDSRGRGKAHRRRLGPRNGRARLKLDDSRRFHSSLSTDAIAPHRSLPMSRMLI